MVNRGAFDGIKFWVDSISGSDNNVGSYSAPFKNLWIAIEKIHASSTVGLIREDVIICKSGSYRMSPLVNSDWSNGARPTNELLGSGRTGWLRIESDASAGRRSVVITNQPNNFGSVTTPTSTGKPNEIFTSFVHIKNISIENANYAYPSVGGNKDDIFITGDNVNLDSRALWIDECFISSSTGVTSEDIIIASTSQQDPSLRSYPEVCSDIVGIITNSSIKSLYNGLTNFILAQEVGFGDIASHATIDCPCLLSCSMSNIGDYGVFSLTSCIYLRELSKYQNNIIISKNIIEYSSVPHFRIETDSQSSSASATSYSVTISLAQTYQFLIILISLMELKI